MRGAKFESGAKWDRKADLNRSDRGTGWGERVYFSDRGEWKGT